MDGLLFRFHHDDYMGDVIEVMSPIVFDAYGKQYTVPIGYLSDGASIPRFFWRLLSPQYDPLTLVPSIIHDYLYTKHILSRQEADMWYRDALIEAGYPRWKAWVSYAGVRLFGWSHWSSQ